MARRLFFWGMSEESAQHGGHMWLTLLFALQVLFMGAQKAGFGARILCTMKTPIPKIVGFNVPLGPWRHQVVWQRCNASRSLLISALGSESYFLLGQGYLTYGIHGQGLQRRPAHAKPDFNWLSGPRNETWKRTYGISCLRSLAPMRRLQCSTTHATFTNPSLFRATPLLRGMF